MACSAGVRVEVDFSTWTGGAFRFPPSKTASGGWFPVARSFRVLPDGISLTSLGSLDFPPPCDEFVTFGDGCVVAAPRDGLVTLGEGCVVAAPRDELDAFREGCAFSAAVAPPAPRTKENATVNTTIAILPIDPPLFKVAPQSQCANFLNIGKFCLEI